MNLHVDELKSWYKNNEKEILDDFFHFLKFKSISTDPSYKNDCLKTASFLEEYLKKIGMEVSLWTSEGMPVVFAEHKAGHDKPTVLIYQHYDVQPVDPIELWSSDPFEPVIKDGKVYARGASDNKGQCYATLIALKKVLQEKRDLPVNIKLFIEGEEESGGAGTQSVLKNKKHLLKADYALVVDFDMQKKDHPSITLGMRGIATFNIECQNSKQDLHSGVHGGIALNPIRALTDVLAKIWDENGTINIPGFYDEVEPVSSKELSKLNMDFDMETYQKDFGVKAFCNEKGVSIKESNWIRPSLEINGISGGYTGVGFKTVLPSKAFAKISCRIVPKQNPDNVEKNIKDFLKEHIAPGIELKMEPHHSARAFRTSSESKIIQIVAESQKEVFKVDPAFTLCGASVPIVVDLKEITGAEVALFGTSLSTDDFHAPNEHFGLDRLCQGFMVMARVLDNLAK